MTTDRTTIAINTTARDEVRRFAAVAGGVLGRRITMADALLLSVAMAETQGHDAYLEAASQLGLINPPESNGETQ